MLYVGSKTGANALKYRTLATEINSSEILNIENRGIRRLCPKCLKELDEWLKSEGGPYKLPPLVGVQGKEKVSASRA
jgi:hypothetical protein